MLTRSELNLIGEIRDEIANMLTRQRGILQDKKATVFAKLAARVTLQALVSIEATILSLSTFTQGSYEALDLVQTIRRITTPTEWEAFNTQYDVPEVIFPKREIIMGMDWGDKSSTVFAEAIKRADGEIEMGIINTYRTGTHINCPLCGRPLEIERDGIIPTHKKFLAGTTCEKSGQLMFIENPRGLSFFDPGFARHGTCGFCNQEWLLDADGTLPGHAIDMQTCRGSHTKPTAELPTYAEGTRVICQYCEDMNPGPEPVKSIRVGHDGVIPRHLNAKEDVCPGSFMKPLAGDERFRLSTENVAVSFKGQCGYCGEYVGCDLDGILDEHLMPEAGRHMGIAASCQGSGVKAVKFSIRSSLRADEKHNPGSEEDEQGQQGQQSHENKS
jgi:hypothetical protein